MDKPSSLEFEIPFSDGSGAEYSVKFHNMSRIADERVIEISDCPDSINIPLDRLDWLIECLIRIKVECIDD